MSIKRYRCMMPRTFWETGQNKIISLLDAGAVS